MGIVIAALIHSACNTTQRECADAPITVGHHDVDIRASRLAVQLRLRGAPVGRANLAHGKLVFREQSGRAVAEVQLGYRAVEPFELLLADGVYDVDYVGPTYCRDEPLPCIGGTIARSIVVGDHPRAVVIDVRPTRYQPAVTIERAFVPEAVDVGIACAHGRELLGVQGERSFEAVASTDCHWIFQQPIDCTRGDACAQVIDGPFALTPEDPRPTLRARIAQFPVSIRVRSPRSSALCTGHIGLSRSPITQARGVDGYISESREQRAVAGRYAMDAYANCTLEGESFRLFHTIGQGTIDDGRPVDIVVDLLRVPFELEADTNPGPDERAREVVFSDGSHTTTATLIPERERPTHAWIPQGTVEALRLSRAGDDRFWDPENITRHTLSHQRVVTRFATPPREGEAMTLRAVSVSPRVAITLDGVPLSDWSRWKFSLWPPTAHADHGVSIWTGYGLRDRLSPGRYNVVLSAIDEPARDSLIAERLPSQRMTVVGQTLGEDGVVRVSIRSARARGNITINGAPVAGTPLVVRFRSTSEPALEHTLTTTDGAFDTTLFASDWRASVSFGKCAMSPVAERVCGEVQLSACAAR
jgi:hypothetical protein